MGSRLLCTYPKRLACASWIALACLAITACGQSGGPKASAGVSSATATTVQSSSVTRGFKGDEDDDDTPNGSVATGKVDNDADQDNDSQAAQNKGYRDSDDASVLDLGQAADTADRDVVERLVKSYYAAAVAGDGKRACGLIYGPFTEAIPED